MQSTLWPVARTAAALAAAMGIGRFAYTPILPLMTAQTPLGAQAAGQLATANYVGYLVGAVATAVVPRLGRSRAMCQTSLAAVTLSLLAMPLTTAVPLWLTLRTIAGLGSALAFVIAVNALLDSVPRHVGFGFGGVGVGIALSAGLVLVVPTDWRTAWWAVAALAVVLTALAWGIRPGPAAAPAGDSGHRDRPGFWLLFGGYTLEGIGYIVAGTFLVAALAQRSPGRMGDAAWLVVGLSVIPSAALWDRVSSRWSRPGLLTVALLLQAAGIALACTGGVATAMLGAILFGGTFIGVSTLALGHGRMLGAPGAVAVLTAGYSVGQIVGPLLVNPLLHSGFQLALGAGGVTVLLAAVVCALMWIIHRKPHPVGADTEVTDIAGEGVDDGQHRGPVLRPAPHQ